MENFSRFFYLLDQLSNTELMQFKKYLYMLNQNRYQRSLILVEAAQRLLVNHKDTIQKANLESEEPLKLLINKFRKRIHKRLFLNKPYNSKAINNYMSDISLMIEEFMIMLHLKKHKIKREEFLFDVSIDRKMSKHIFMTLKRKKKHLESKSDRSFWYNYELFKIYYYSYFRPEVPKNKGLAHKKTLEDLVKALQQFYITALLKIVCEKLTLHKMANYEYPEDLIKNINTYFESFKDKTTAISLYSKFFLFLQKPTETDFEDIKTKVFESIQLFSTEEKSGWITLLSNYYATMVNKTGAVKYKIMYVKTFRLSLEHKILGQESYIEPTVFIGVYQMASKVDKSISIELLNYIDALPKQERKNAKILCEAFSYFEEDDFLKAHSTLQQIKYTTQAYLIRARVLQLKCYYEMRHENFMNPRDYGIIFRRHLRLNNHIDLRTKTTIINLIRVINLLIKVEPNLEEIKLSIQTLTPLGAKSWLEAKVLELEEKNVRR